MIKPNNLESNSQLLGTQNCPSNTPLFLHLPLTLTTNSFNRFLSTSNKAKVEIYNSLIHLDYLRISTTINTKKAFDRLLADIGLPIPCFENKLFWHPDPKMSKKKKFQNSIQSDTGIKLGYTKRLKNRSRKPKYVYDIMIDFTGAYFADLSLLEQMELIYHLNANRELKCHRLDVAIDDYSRKLFPVEQIISAYREGKHFGFQSIDERYVQMTNHRFSGTLGIGSRRSNLFIRIYTRHKSFVRYEAELKGDKAKKLLTDLIGIVNSNLPNNTQAYLFLKALEKAAVGDIDFRSSSHNLTAKNTTRARTERLLWWSECRENISASIENLTKSNYSVDEQLTQLT